MRCVVKTGICEEIWKEIMYVYALGNGLLAVASINLDRLACLVWL